MKKLLCRDIGGDCEFIARGSDLNQILILTNMHITEDHPESIRELGSEWKQQIKNAVIKNTKDY
jgi:predicted small metal-binding protein